MIEIYDEYEGCPMVPLQPWRRNNPQIPGIPRINNHGLHSTAHVWGNIGGNMVGIDDLGGFFQSW